MGFNIGGSVLSSKLVTPDNTLYGKRFRKVTLDMIDTVQTSGTGTVSSQANDANGYYTMTYLHQNSGCDSSGFAIKIKRDIKWSYCIADFYMEGVASCWSFNGTSYAPNSGMIGWSSAAGDLFFDPFNSWDQSQFSVKTFACDNNSDNFMHGSFAVGSNRGFTILSRRDGNAYAGPGHGRACNGSGTTIVSNIIIF